MKKFGKESKRRLVMIAECLREKIDVLRRNFTAVPVAFIDKKE